MIKGHHKLTEEQFSAFFTKNRKNSLNNSILNSFIELQKAWKTSENFLKQKCILSLKNEDLEAVSTTNKNLHCSAEGYWLEEKISQPNHLTKNSKLKQFEAVPCGCSWLKKEIHPLFFKFIFEFRWDLVLSEIKKNKMPKLTYKKFFEDINLISEKNVQKNFPQEKINFKDKKNYEQKKTVAINFIEINNLFFSEKITVVIQEWLVQKSDRYFWNKHIGWNKTVFFLETMPAFSLFSDSSTLSESFCFFLECLENLNCRMLMYSQREIFSNKKIQKITPSALGGGKTLYRDNKGRLRTSLNALNEKNELLSWEDILPEKNFDILLKIIKLQEKNL
jgi:hypothetical protein